LIYEIIKTKILFNLIWAFAAGAAPGFTLQLLAPLLNGICGRDGSGILFSVGIKPGKKDTAYSPGLLQAPHRFSIFTLAGVPANETFTLVSDDAVDRLRYAAPSRV
jgi:hypothetical protein